MYSKKDIKLKKFLKKFNLNANLVQEYRKSFIHRSFLQVDKEATKNERLEFLGDAVLELIITDYLFKNYEIQEGKLSQIRARVVSEEPLYNIAKKIGIDKLIYLGKGEELNGGRNKPSILSDTFEALIGNIYLLEGFDKAYSFTINLLKPLVEDVFNNRNFLNAKTLLQEITQKKYKQLPEYLVVKEEEIDGQKYYTMKVVVGDNVFGPVTSYSKKKAEFELANIALQKIK